MRDFTLKTYRQLLESLSSKGYQFITYEQCVKRIEQGAEREERFLTRKGIRNDETQRAIPSSLCVLRHDVDRLAANSLATAKIEKELGIRGTYYFRIVPASFDERIIRQIAEMGHEVGYHYEEVDIAYRQLKIKNSKLKICIPDNNNAAMLSYNNAALIDLAYELFKVNLEKLRTITPVTTICMHGSPLSPFDNKEIWNKYNYKELGIIGEPYFDLDWNEFGYLTDTGRRWNGESVSVRDKVVGQSAMGSRKLEGKRLKEKEKSLEQWLSIKDQLRSTGDVIKAIEENKITDKLMITVHPQRWTDSPILWVKELILQNVKNVVKRVLVKIND